MAVHERDRDPRDRPHVQPVLQLLLQVLEQDDSHGNHPLPHHHSAQHGHSLEDCEKLKVQKEFQVGSVML